MKKLIIAITIFFFAVGAYAQTQHNSEFWALAIQPHYAVRSLNSTAGTAITDSLNNSQKGRTGFSASIQYHKEMGKDWTFQTALQYTNVGFTQVEGNLTYKTKIHPDLPPLDQSISTLPGPTANLNYVFDYLDAVALMNRRIYFSNKKLKNWDFFISMGGSANFLLDDRIAVRLRGFTIDNKRAFNIKDNHLSSRFLNLTANLGMKVDYLYSNKLSFFFQPLLSVPLLPATSGNYSYRFLYGGINVGFFYNFAVKGEEELID